MPRWIKYVWYGFAKVHRSLACIMELLGHLLAQGDRIMSAISDFKAKMDAHNAKIDAAVSGLQGDVQTLNDKITQLQNSAGQITPEDQATLDEIEVQAGVIADKLDALDQLTPPAPPQG